MNSVEQSIRDIYTNDFTTKEELDNFLSKYKFIIEFGKFDIVKKYGNEIRFVKKDGISISYVFKENIIDKKILIKNKSTETIKCANCKHLGIKDFVYGYCKHINGLKGIVFPDYYCVYGVEKNEDV